MSIDPPARDAVLEQVEAAVSRWPAFAAETGVDGDRIDAVERRLGQARAAALAPRR